MVVTSSQVLVAALLTACFGCATATRGPRVDPPQQDACPSIDVVGDRIRELSRRGWLRAWSADEIAELFGADPENVVDDRGNSLGFTWRHTSERGDRLVCAEGAYLRADGSVNSVSVLRFASSRSEAAGVGAEVVKVLTAAEGLVSKYATPGSWGDAHGGGSWRRVEPLGSAGGREGGFVITVNLDSVGNKWQVGVALGDTR